MKVPRIAALAIALLLIGGGFSSPALAEASFGFFYSNLSSHGSWLVSASSGRVWQPAEYSSGWNPYYDGHWVYTDLGWTWVSDYTWGAIPYHYGTWTFDPELGWVWVPGYVWAPAWVVFRTGPDYIGWAPVAPGFSVGVSLTFGDYAPDRFVFVSAGNFLSPSVRRVVVPASTTNVIINRTQVVNNITIENNIVVNRGPDVKVIERVSGKRVSAVPIERVPHVAPGSSVTRAQLRVDPEKARHGLRVAEPVSAKEPLPVAEGEKGQRERGNGEKGQREKGRARSPETAQQQPPQQPLKSGRGAGQGRRGRTEEPTTAEGTHASSKHNTGRQPPVAQAESPTRTPHGTSERPRPKKDQTAGQAQPANVSPPAVAQSPQATKGKEPAKAGPAKGKEKEKGPQRAKRPEKEKKESEGSDKGND